MHDGRANEKIAIRLSNDNYNPGNKNYIQNNFSSEGDKHLHIDPGASMPSVIQSVTFTSANKIQVFSPTVGGTVFQMNEDTDIAIVKHDDLTGCSVNLPLSPLDGQTCRIKNYQTSASPTSTSVVYVNPAGSVATTIDGRFYQLKLVPSSSTGDLEESANQCGTFVYCAAESTWISISDAY
jgi:hypothetical protein